MNDLFTPLLWQAAPNVDEQADPRHSDQQLRSIAREGKNVKAAAAMLRKRTKHPWNEMKDTKHR